MTHDLVVGVDGSQESAAAMRWALAYAARHAYGVTLVHAFSLPLPDAYGLMLTPPDLDQWSGYADQLVQAAAASAREQAPEVPIDVSIRQGPPAAVLVDASRSASGVVLGVRGAGAISGRQIGSVSVRVSVRSVCPVYVIPAEWQPTDDPRPVVVGVDGSEFSDAALRVAVAEAKELGVGLRVIIAYHVAYLARPIEPELIARYHADEQDLARRTVEEALARVHCDREAVPVEIRVVDDQPSRALVAAGADAALTVVGSRGRGAISRALLGSVSRSVMQHTLSPLCVVHLVKDAAKE